MRACSWMLPQGRPGRQGRFAFPCALDGPAASHPLGAAPGGIPSSSPTDCPRGQRTSGFSGLPIMHRPALRAATGRPPRPAGRGGSPALPAEKNPLAGAGPGLRPGRPASGLMMRRRHPPKGANEAQRGCAGCSELQQAPKKGACCCNLHHPFCVNIFITSFANWCANSLQKTITLNTPTNNTRQTNKQNTNINAICRTNRLYEKAYEP